MNTPINEAVEREAFEKAYGPKDSFAWRNEDGTYKVQSLQMAWEIWLRRAALPPPIVEPVAWALLYECDPQVTTDSEIADYWKRKGRNVTALYTTPASAPSDGGVDERALDPVVEANRALLLERSKVGIKKYGVTLGAGNLSEPELLLHTLQELLDGANYIQTILMRKRS